jgi:putative ABC transport system substrate-binding protein
MHHYRTLLNDSRPNTDAIWLPLDRVTVNDDVVLPLLLQSAWNNNLAIISNKPAHAKRGALFAMYPDHYGLGQELSALLKQLTGESRKSQVIPLKRLQLAVNLRTASHLGLSFTPDQKDDFTLTFPSR